MFRWVLQRPQLTVTSTMLDSLNLWCQYRVQLLFRIVHLGPAM